MYVQHIELETSGVLSEVFHGIHPSSELYIKYRINHSLLHRRNKTNERGWTASSKKSVGHATTYGPIRFATCD